MGILNQAVELICNVNGSEPLTIEWFKNEKKVENSWDKNNLLIQVFLSLFKFNF